MCSGNFELRLTSARVIISREPLRRDLVEAAVWVGRWDRSSTAGDLVAATPLMTHTRCKKASEKKRKKNVWQACLRENKREGRWQESERAHPGGRRRDMHMGACGKGRLVWWRGGGGAWWVAGRKRGERESTSVQPPFFSLADWVCEDGQKRQPMCSA